MYGSISKTVAILKTTSNEIARTITMGGTTMKGKQYMKNGKPDGCQ